MNELALLGGNATVGVVRVGDTVRKPWTKSSAVVQELLVLLSANGIDVPRPLGRDEQGRQVLEYVEGTPAIDLPALRVDELRRVGVMVRTIHDVCAEIGPRLAEAWKFDVRIPAAQADLLCHNDLGSWNLIMGDRWVFIDWDAFGPSSRLWDLAYAAQSIANLNAGEPVREAAVRLSAFVDGYGADQTLRSALPNALAHRTRGMFEMLAAANREGRQPWGRMFEEGHGAHWLSASDYVVAHQTIWRETLLG